MIAGMDPTNKNTNAVNFWFERIYSLRTYNTYVNQSCHEILSYHIIN